jgi:hypothetical protein
VNPDPDPCLRLMDLDADPDADPGPAILIIDLQDANEKLKKKFLVILLFEGTFRSFFIDKK